MADAPNDETPRAKLERAIVGALRSTINEHGPINNGLMTSATKRVIGNLANMPGLCALGADSARTVLELVALASGTGQAPAGQGAILHAIRQLHPKLAEEFPGLPWPPYKRPGTPPG